MLKAPWLQQSLYSLLCIVAFVIPFPYIYSALAIFLIVISWVLQFDPKTTWHHLKSRKALWIWLLFYLLHVASYFYSQDKAQSLFNLQQKLSILLLPVIVGAGITISRELLEKILLSFIYGITVVAAFCIGKAFVIYLHTGETSQFFYHSLVTGLEANAVYQSWYCLFSLAIIMFFPWKVITTMNRLPVKALMLELQVTFFVLLSARTLFIVFLVFLIPVFLADIYRKSKKSRLYVALLIGICLFLTTFLFTTDNPIKQRYNSVLNEKVTMSLIDNKNLNNHHFNNLNLRIFLWQLGIENVKEHHLWWRGAGNGDVEHLQNEKMLAHGIDINARIAPLKNVNLHNMYLEALMMIGVPGLALLILFTFIPFVYIKKIEFKYLYFLFFFTGIIVMLQESALETQAGIIFYTLFSQIFLNQYYSREKRIISRQTTSGN